MNLVEQLTTLTSPGPNGFGLEQAILGLMLAFVLGQLSAWVYVYTHTGLSYSRSFVQSIVMLTIIIALGMMVIGSNILIAFGLIGALAVIRFRNILKDTRDTAFIFLSLIVGMASGTGSYHLAVLGTLTLSAVLLYLHWASFGSRNTSDGYVRFRVGETGSAPDSLQAILATHCRSAQLVSQRLLDRGGEFAYRLTMRDPASAGAFVEEIQRMEGVSNVSFVLHEEQAEV